MCLQWSLPGCMLLPAPFPMCLICARVRLAACARSLARTYPQFLHYPAHMLTSTAFCLSLSASQSLLLHLRASIGLSASTVALASVASADRRPTRLRRLRRAQYADAPFRRAPRRCLLPTQRSRRAIRTRPPSPPPPPPTSRPSRRRRRSLRSLRRSAAAADRSDAAAATDRSDAPTDADAADRSDAPTDRSDAAAAADRSDVAAATDRSDAPTPTPPAIGRMPQPRSTTAASASASVLRCNAEGIQRSVRQ